jgi:protein TonB
MLVLSKEEFAASDISKLGRHSADPNGDTGAEKGGEADEGVGEGPGGEKLYNAEWYREPTKTEMATYLPGGMAEPGWAMIACRTADRFRVEDCQELSESPPGSGLSRALRQAAWQFLVRPPRIGGKALVGAWVRIRFDFNREEKQAARN